MISRTDIAYSLAKVLPITAMALCVVLSVSCNDKDDTADMAAQMQQIRQQQTQREPATRPQLPPANPCNPVEGTEGTEEPVVPEYTGPTVSVKDFSVKLPYPEFDSAGRYDIKCSIQANEEVDSSTVWEIIARGADGEQVGHKKLHLVIYDSYYKPLDLNSFYCTSVPASLEFRATDTKPTKAGEAGEAGGENQRGNRGGQAVKPGI